MSDTLPDENTKILDPSHIYSQLVNFSDDCVRAWKEAEHLNLPFSSEKIKKIVLVGMGGSGIAGEAIKDLLYEGRVGIEIVHDYTLPGYTDNETLVVVTSYSGNTEEALAAFRQALSKKAQIFTITTGGTLKNLSEQNDVPCFLFDYKSQPRMAFPYLFTPLVYLFTYLGLYNLEDSFESVCVEVGRNSRQFFTPADDNFATELSKDLKAKLPIIYTGPKLKSIGSRFKTLFNENSKSFALSENFPELNHNSIVGYSFPKIPVHFLIIESAFDSEPIKKRIEITQELLRQHNFSYKRLLFKCSNQLAEILTFISLADSASYFLALVNNVEPASTDNINYLKERL